MEDNETKQPDATRKNKTENKKSAAENKKAVVGGGGLGQNGLFRCFRRHPKLILSIALGGVGLGETAIADSGWRKIIFALSRTFLEGNASAGDDEGKGDDEEKGENEEKGDYEEKGTATLDSIAASSSKAKSCLSFCASPNSSPSPYSACPNETKHGDIAINATDINIVTDINKLKEGKESEPRLTTVRANLSESSLLNITTTNLAYSPT